MTKGLSTLQFVFPDGQVPDWYQGPEKALALVAGFDERYESLKTIFDSGYLDSYDIVKDLEKLSRDFFWAWMTSSPAVIAALGSPKVMEILELFSTYRGITWEYEHYAYYEQLPDHIEIFRGGSGTLDNVLLGFSWSLSKEIAEQFANSSLDGILLRAEIAKKDVLLVSSLECELVPRLSSLSNVVQIHPSHKA